MDAPPPPPPPPPHSSHTQGQRSGGLPDGKYDIFVIPPSSAGSGFLYLPSLQTQRNSFIAGAACTAVAFFIWSIAVPVVREWFSSIITGGGTGVVFLLFVVAVMSWAWGKTQAEGSGGGSGAGPTGGSTFAGGQPQQGAYTGFPPPPKPPPAGPQTPPPKPSWQRPAPQANSNPSASAKTSWEKAREETRKKEEERRKSEELRKKREELEKERQKQREKDVRERLERELKQKKEREERDKQEKEKREAAGRSREQDRTKENSPPKRPPFPSVRTENDDDAYSFRPYDRPKRPVHKTNSAASMYSESSYAPSQTTAKTTPPPSTRGPYTTKDPDKIIIKAVYAFNNAFMRTPMAQLISGQGNVTDGLILRITTEGLFIDDDVRGVAQREWDIKAWTLKLAESVEVSGLHILRASIRDQEGKKYVFIISQTEGWKVAVGLQRLRKGTQVRAMGVAGLPANEVKMLIETLGWG